MRRCVLLFLAPFAAAAFSAFAQTAFAVGPNDFSGSVSGTTQNPPLSSDSVGESYSIFRQSVLLADNAFPSLEDFAAEVENGDVHSVVGVYAYGVMALKVVQQPDSNPGYVSWETDTATQFALAARQGTTGLLAHNFLAGSLFFNLARDEEVDAVLGNGTVRRYRITDIRHYQALSPFDPYSNFLNLDKPEPLLTSTDLFNQVYGGGDKVVFQTCINANGSATWGRLFVIATPG